MTDDWREHARRGEWTRIPALLLSEDDLAELNEMLRRIVPTRKRGHGVETFEGFIRPEEANSEAEYEASLFAEYLTRDLQRRKRKAAYDCPLDEAVDFAIATLQEHGIKYEGYRETFLYWRTDRSGWLQIPGSMAAAIRAKISEMWDRLTDLPMAERDTAIRRLMAWQTMYPWRTCKSLFEVFQINAFETHTPMWHALSIFDWYEQFRDADDLIRSDDGDHSIEQLLKDAVESAFEIGLNFEALVKKPYEPHALHGQQFPSGTTDKATEEHMKRAQHRADQVLFAARAVLQSGLGRKQNGDINHSKLAEEIALKYSKALNIRITESRIAQIIKTHILSGKLK